METTHEISLACEQRFNRVETDIEKLQIKVDNVCGDVGLMKTETKVTATIVERIEKVMWWILTGVIGSVLVSIVIAIIK